MKICEDCQRSSLTVERRQGGDMLCKCCDEKRTAGLPQRILRSSLSKKDSSGNETVSPVHTDDSSTSVGNAGLPSQDNPVSSQGASATKEPLTPEEPFLEPSLNSSKLNVQPSSNLHCHEQCKYDRCDQGDMIRCCLCFRWFHESCVDNIDKETPWWVCPGCRAFPTSLASLCSTMAQMQGHMTTLMIMNQTLITSVNELKCQNGSLASQADILSRKLSNFVKHKPRAYQIPRPPFPTYSLAGPLFGTLHVQTPKVFTLYRAVEPKRVTF